MLLQNHFPHCMTIINLSNQPEVARGIDKRRETQPVAVPVRYPSSTTIGSSGLNLAKKTSRKWLKTPNPRLYRLGIKSTAGRGEGDFCCELWQGGWRIEGSDQNTSILKSNGDWDLLDWIGSKSTPGAWRLACSDNWCLCLINAYFLIFQRLFSTSFSFPLLARSPCHPPYSRRTSNKYNAGVVASCELGLFGTLFFFCVGN